GGKFYMDRLKVDNLYRHGFQLYEEQIATYLNEHYSGISKIEFSPIFISGGKGESFLQGRVVPVIYDTYGNKVYLRNDGFVEKVLVDYSMVFGTDLDFNVNDGSEIINLRDDKRRHNSVIWGEPLPENLKWVDHETTDEAMDAFSREGLLKDVEKNSQGSPQAEIDYNLEIRRIDERELDKWK
ncbi:hypothetical protein DHL47_06250, partial [Streptococcus panodentis]